MNVGFAWIARLVSFETRISCIFLSGQQEMTLPLYSKPERKRLLGLNSTNPCIVMIVENQSTSKAHVSYQLLSCLIDMNRFSVPEHDLQPVGLPRRVRSCH